MQHAKQNTMTINLFSKTSKAVTTSKHEHGLFLIFRMEKESLVQLENSNLSVNKITTCIKIAFFTAQLSVSLQRQTKAATMTTLGWQIYRMKIDVGVP